MMLMVRACLLVVWRLVCVAGGWVMERLAALFLGVALGFGWTGGACSYAADWLFAKANRIRRHGRSANRMGGA